VIYFLLDLSKIAVNTAIWQHWKVAKCSKSCEPFLERKIGSSKNPSFFRGDVKKTKYAGGPYFRPKL
jgi:hypothetical protein